MLVVCCAGRHISVRKNPFHKYGILGQQITNINPQLIIDSWIELYGTIYNLFPPPSKKKKTAGGTFAQIWGSF